MNDRILFDDEIEDDLAKALLVLIHELGYELYRTDQTKHGDVQLVLRRPEPDEDTLERVARALCKARGVDPDAMQHYDDGTFAHRKTHAWRIAALELQAAKRLTEHVEMLR